MKIRSTSGWIGWTPQPPTTTQMLDPKKKNWYENEYV